MTISKTLLAFFMALTVATASAWSGDIAEVDKNFRPATTQGLDVNFFDVSQAPFSFEGFPWATPEVPITRLPVAFTEQEINKRALRLSRHSSGGAVRFRSNSPYMALFRVCRSVERLLWR